MFTDGPSDDASSSTVHRNLRYLAGASLLVHELHVAQLVGPSRLRGWAGSVALPAAPRYRRPPVNRWGGGASAVRDTRSHGGAGNPLLSSGDHGQWLGELALDELNRVPGVGERYLPTVEGDRARAEQPRAGRATAKRNRRAPHQAVPDARTGAVRHRGTNASPLYVQSRGVGRRRRRERDRLLAHEDGTRPFGQRRRCSRVGEGARSGAC